jgi:hypothetical protein
MEKRFITFLERYDADDLALFVRVLQDLSGTNWIAPQAVERKQRRAIH